jgi:hypothetical protein
MIDATRLRRERRRTDFHYQAFLTAQRLNLS